LGIVWGWCDGGGGLWSSTVCDGLDFGLWESDGVVLLLFDGFHFLLLCFDGVIR